MTPPGSPLPRGGDDVVLDVAPVERPRTRVLTGRISEMSRNRPQEAAALIRNMLEEE